MEIREFIENKEWYTSGSNKTKSVSASKIGGDLLPIWLSKKFRKDKSKMIGVNYVGSAFHRGMEEELEHDDYDNRYLTEHTNQKELSNKWLVHGTADVLDANMEHIHDYKTTSASGYKNMKKDALNKSSQLAIQGAVLKYVNDFRGEFFAEVFIRDFKPWRKDHPASAYQQLSVETYSSQEIEKYLVAKTDSLDGYLSRNEAPPECDNVMWMVYNSERIKLKCEYYCDYKKSCPHYAKKTNHLAATKIKICGW